MPSGVTRTRVDAIALALRPYVAWYSGYRQVGGLPGRHRGLPSPYVTLIVTLDEPIEVAVPSDPRQAPHTYGTLPAGELANIDVQMTDVLGPLALELHGRVREARSSTERFAVLDRFLLRRLEAGAPRSRVPRDRRLLGQPVGRRRVPKFPSLHGRRRLRLTA